MNHLDRAEPSRLVPTLGCVADDLTGATDVASALTDAGLSVTLILGVPVPSSPVGPCDAVVVALKSRTLPVDEAVRQSSAALNWLRGQGVSSFYLKYCSTFDSTEAGNIGPVADAAMQLLDRNCIVHAPAYPANKRTVYQGHLFVGHSLLSESGMEYHPLTPMTDPNLVRFLAHQTPFEVALLPLEVIKSDAPVRAIHDALQALPQDSRAHVIADSVSNADLDTIATAAIAENISVLAGGAAFAASWAKGLGLGDHASLGATFKAATGAAAVLVGSASSTTRRQIAAFAVDHPTRKLSIEGLEAPDELATELVRWGAKLMGEGPVLIAADTTPEGIAAARERFGHEAASARIERTLGLVAVGLKDAGVRRFVVAGGETSGAVADALGLLSLRVGPSIAAGVPWTRSKNPDLEVAFKSGNFGGDQFFAEALDAGAQNDPRRISR